MEKASKDVSGVLAIFYFSQGCWSHGCVQFIKIHQAVHPYVTLKELLKTKEEQKQINTLINDPTKLL